MPKKFSMKSCTAAYLKAQYDPFGVMITPPCIPDARAIPAQRFTLRQRGQLRADGNGNAIIFLNPYTINGSPTTGNNPIIFSTGLGNQTTPGVGTGMQLDNLDLGAFGGDTGLSVLRWNSPWGPDRDARNKFRVVGAGIKVNYAGEWEKLSGNVQVFHHPTNDRAYFDTTRDVRPGGELTNFQETAFGSLSHNTGVECSYHPVDIEDYDFKPGEPESFVMGIVITGAPVATGWDKTDGAPFTFECIAHYEAVGPDMHATQTSESDVYGFSRVNNLPKAQTVNTSGPTLFQTFWNWFTRTESEAGYFLNL